MQVAILAGGLGTRLWPMTKDVPKPMVPVAGVPYLEHQLRLLAKQGFKDILLLTGYLGDQVEDYFGDGSRMGLRIRYSREMTPIGTGGAIRQARDIFDGEAFLLIYGDSYLPIRYMDAAERLLADDTAQGLLVLFRDASGETNVKPNVALDASGRVKHYDKSGVDDPELQYIEAGVLALRRSILDLLPADGVVSLEQQIFPRLITEGRLLGLPTSQRFFDIGTPERLKIIEAYLA